MHKLEWALAAESIFGFALIFLHLPPLWLFPLLKDKDLSTAKLEFIKTSFFTLTFLADSSELIPNTWTLIRLKALLSPQSIPFKVKKKLLQLIPGKGALPTEISFGRAWGLRLLLVSPGHGCGGSKYWSKLKKTPNSKKNWRPTQATKRPSKIQSFWHQCTSGSSFRSKGFGLSGGAWLWHLILCRHTSRVCLF